jgi:dienelactone hydrolase
MKSLLLLFALVGTSFSQTPADNESPASKTAQPPVQMHWIEREFLMPVRGAPQGIDVLQVEVERPGKHPLAILTHGTAAERTDRATVTPWIFLPQAIWFARRGYVVLVVVRKGYGRSSGDQDGKFGGCQTNGRGSFVEAGEDSADDLRAAAKYAEEKLPEVDTGTVVSAGVSTGGFAQVALSADPPSGLKATISFAGGRGGDGKEHNCNLGELVSAFQHFGKKSRLPMLWIYSENDHWFTPPMAHQFDEAFRKGGGVDQLVMVPPYREDGHGYYYNISGWTPLVEDFLREHGLLTLTGLLPAPPVPDVALPAGLTDRGQSAFRNFLIMGPSKAFATNGAEVFGMSYGQFDQSIADKKALENCGNASNGHGRCSVVARTE